MPLRSSGRVQHAAMWLIGQDMPGLLNLGARWVADHGGNIDKDIADKFGEKAVVFMSISAKPEDIKRMDGDKVKLKEASGCGVVFQAMHQPTVPDGFQPELHGFDIVTDDATGLIAEITQLLADFSMVVIGHTGERRTVPGPVPKDQSGQKFVVMLPHMFDHAGFTKALNGIVRRHNGILKSPLQKVPGLLWWW